MQRAIRFVLVLVVGLGVLTFIADRTLSRTTRSWFESDVSSRAQLAVASARRTLLTDIRANDSAAIQEQLREIAQDVRITGGAVCADGRLLAATEFYPRELSCRTIDLRRRLDGRRDGSGLWSTTTTLRGGPVFVSSILLMDSDDRLGEAVLIHDMTFVVRREEKTRSYLLIAFAGLAIMASLLTIVAARIAWRAWVRDLRRALAGKAESPEYKPLLRDMRALVARLAAERSDNDQSGRWTPARLRASLSQFLEGERVVILANREPYIHQRQTNGSIMVTHPASGLVSAIEPVMRACSGVWVAHGSGTADREVTDARGHVLVPPGENSYRIRRVWLDEHEEQGYYYGLSNEGLWPLCHVAHARPVFRADDWEQYKRVNRKFAEAVCEEVDSDDPIILVQDYHFALAPALIRQRLPRATILTFWHIPWPNAERFGICPWRDELLQGLLGSSILGFHTQQHCNNFIDSIDSFVEARIDREHNAIVQGARKTLVRPYPISIEWPVHWLEDLPDAPTCRQEIFTELGLRPDALLGVGIDRLDYTKGIEERLLAVERLLEREPAYRGRFTFVQLAAPSRTRIDRYRELNDAVESTAARVNARFGSEDYRPIVLLRQHHEPPRVFKFYRAADLCYVSSLHDGMNLVAKEFVAAREDEMGVLVLSQFTGAARELTEALIVNPYDLEEASSALAEALAMPKRAQQERMRSMRSLVSTFNVYRWAGKMLIDATELRRRERLSGRLNHPFGLRALAS